MNLMPLGCHGSVKERILKYELELLKAEVRFKGNLQIFTYHLFEKVYLNVYNVNMLTLLQVYTLLPSLGILAQIY